MSEGTPTVLQLQQQIAALQDLVMALQQSQQPPASAPPPPSVPASSQQFKGLKVAPPDVFNGAMDKSEGFISQLQLFFHGKRHELQDDSDKVILALSYMKGGTAGSWAQDKVRIFSQTGVTPSWDEFLTEFKSIFGDPDPASSARYKMNHLKQGAMTCDEYVSAFRALVNDSQLNDTALVEKFENGLNSGLVDKIYNLPEMPVTLKGWMTWACKLDRQWRKRTGNRLNRSAVPTVSERLTKPSSATPKSNQDMGMGVGLSQSTAQASLSRPSPPVAPRVPVSGPVPMEVDSSWKRVRPPLVCFKCRKPGHKAVDCRSRVDIRLLDNKGLMAYMQSELVQEERAEKADSPKEDF